MSVCPSAFVLSGYVHPDDGGANMIYRLTSNDDGGPQRSVSGGTATPCGTWVPQVGIIGAHCDLAVCADTTTLLRTWKSDGLPPGTFAGTAVLSLLAGSINPWNTWYRQSFTADFTIERGGATVYRSPAFTHGGSDFSGGVVYLSSVDGVYFTALGGETLVLNVYVILSYRGCRSDDGLRPGVTHGGTAPFGDARGILRISNILAPGAQSLAVYPSLACQAWPVVKREVWATHLAAGPGGVEVRQGNWSAPLLEWELTYDVLRSGAVLGTAYTEMEQLMGFFGARRGQFDAFLFDDVTDNAATLEQIGTGDGITTAFTLTRTLGGSVAPVGRPNLISAVTVGGVATTTYTTSGNVITFATPPAIGAAVVWSGTYYWLVRFADAELTLENFVRQLWASRSVKLRQVRV
jgi:uncharacterized protein (TIGR02217 family)